MPYQIMYSSKATEQMTVDELGEILSDARIGNKARNITGALVYVDGVFFQILEGDKDAVRKLMSSIARDSRHKSVKVFYDTEVDERVFQSWSMAYLSPTPEQMSIWVGLPGTTTVEKLLAEVKRNPDRVPHLLISVLNALVEQDE